MKYDLIIFDIGKTLFDKNLSDRASNNVLRDIERLRENGIKVGVCTMRTISHCMEVVPVEFDFYISLNGSYIVCEKKLIVNTPMTIPSNCKDFLSYGKEFTYYSTDKAKHMADENGFIADKKGVAQPAYNTVIFNVPSNEVSRYNNYNTEYWEKTKTLSIQNKSTSRVLGVREVLKFYGIGQQYLYIGDGPNDLEIFIQHKNCVCMGECYPVLKKYALFQTKSCKEEGVSYALRKLNLL